MLDTSLLQPVGFVSLEELENIRKHRELIQEVRNRLSCGKSNARFLIDPCFNWLAVGWLTLRPETAEAWIKQAGYNCIRMVHKTNRRWWEVWRLSQVEWLEVTYQPV